MRRALVVAVLLSGSCAHRSLQPGGEARWLEVRTEHFTLRADTTGEEARRAAAQLERIRDGLLASSWHAKVDTTGRVEVVLLEDLSELEEFLPHGFQGVATEDPFGRLLIAATAEQSGDVPVLKHELAHAIAHAFLLREPRWLAEGLATYLETLQLTKDSVRAGAVDSAAAVQLARRERFDFDRVRAAGPEIYAQSAGTVRAFYAQSWLLVHVLVDRHRAAFDDYLRRLARAEDPQAAFSASFPGLTEQELTSEANDALVHGFRIVEFPLPRIEVALSLRPLRPGEVHATLAELRLAATRLRPAPFEAVVEEARRALELEPGEPLATALLAADPHQSTDARHAAAEAAIRTHPDDPRSWLLLAEAATDPHSPEFRTSAEKAVALAPTDPRALVLLTDARLAQGRFPEALEAAQRAVQHAPGRAPALDALATALADVGRCAEARQVAVRVAEVLPDSASPRAVEESRDRVALLAEACARAQANAAPSEPRKLSCSAGPGPKLPSRIKGLQRGAVVRVRYHVERDGAVSAVVNESQAPAKVFEAVSRYVRSCRFAPARQGTEPVASDVVESWQLQ